MEKYYWPYMRRDTNEYVQRCKFCPSRKPLNRKVPVKSMAKKLPEEGLKPFSVIHLDLMDLPSKETFRKNKYIVLAIDTATRYVETKALTANTSEKVAEFIFNDIVCRHGAPKVLVTDNGTNLTSDFINKVCENLQINHKLCTTYHPQANGLAEKANGTIKMMLSSLISDSQRDWDVWLPSVTFAYNSTPHSITGFSPFFLLHGDEPTLPVDTKINRKEYFEKDQLMEKPTEMSERLHHYRQLAQRRLKIAGEKMENITSSRYIQVYKPGDRVWVMNAPRPASIVKGFWKAWKGPYTVIENYDDVSYKVCKTDEPNIILKVHAEKLKRYFEDNTGNVVVSVPTSEDPTTAANVANAAHPEQVVISVEDDSSDYFKDDIIKIGDNENLQENDLREIDKEDAPFNMKIQTQVIENSFYSRNLRTDSENRTRLSM